MSAPAEEFYSEERWENWLTRLREADLDPDDENAARLLLNLQDDVAIAVAKILRAYEADELDDDGAIDELSTIHETVSTDPGMDDEEKAMLVGGVQMSLDPVFYAAQEYVVNGPAEEGSVEEYVTAALEAETEEDLDRAIGLVTIAGTRVIDGETFGLGVVESMEPGYVTEWVNGLHSLQEALADPEVIEEDGDE